MPEREERTFQTLSDAQVSTGTETEETETGKPNSKDVLQNTSSGSSGFDGENAHSHGHLLTLACVHGSLNTAPKKAYARLAAPDPLPSSLGVLSSSSP